MEPPQTRIRESGHGYYAAYDEYIGQYPCPRYLTLTGWARSCPEYYPTYEACQTDLDKFKHTRLEITNEDRNAKQYYEEVDRDLLNDDDYDYQRRN